MEGSTQKALEITSAAVGILAVAVVLLLYVRSRRRKTPTKDLSPEWAPVRCLKYHSLNSSSSSSNLADQVTRVIPQTIGHSRQHDYPTATPDPWGARPKSKSSPSPSKNSHTSPSPNFNFSESSSPTDQVKQRLIAELQDSMHAESLSSLASDEESNIDLEVHQNLGLYDSRNDAMGSPPEFLAEEWSAPSRHPAIEFSVVYVSASNTLVVHVLKLLNLFLKDRASSTVVVKIKLVNQKATAAAPPYGHSTSCKKIFDEETGAVLTFPVQSCTYLRNFCLLISLRRTRFGKLGEKPLGEINYSLAQLELCSEVSVRCIEKLILHRKTKNEDSLKVKHLNEDHGQLMLSLFYQLEGNRMKVLVRKAVNLPKKKKILGKQEYYVIVSTFYGGKNMATQETKSAFGRSPVWNHPMIFDMPARNLEKYSIQFIVMHGKVTDRAGVVGQIVIGPDVRGSGQSHWKEATFPRSSEAARWHQLQPL